MPGNGADKDQEPKATVIKKYANRRLYNTGTSTYVTLEDLAEMVKGGEDFVVVDAKSSKDITRPVLTQIIFEQEGKGQNLLPISFLRQLIRFYGDSMQALVPSYLSHSIDTLARDEDNLRGKMASSFGAGAFDVMDEQVKRNMAMFEQAMRIFSPFAAAARNGADAGSTDAKAEPATPETEMDLLKAKLLEMEKRLEDLSRK